MRPIDADALLEKMQRTSRYFSVVYDVDAMPTLDVVPVVHGKWTKVKKSSGAWACSACGTTVGAFLAGCSQYCYCCGTKMDGWDKDD